MTMNAENSVELLQRHRAGDADAANELFARYVERLTQLARARLSPALATRTAPEDIVLSAYRSFFIGARQGRFTLTRSGDLWRLLASIALHKVYHAARWHRTAARSIHREISLENAEVFARGPSPEETVSVTDELQAVLSDLEPLARRVLELRLQEQSLAEISAAVCRSERTVRRIIAEIRTKLSRRLEVRADE